MKKILNKSIILILMILTICGITGCEKKNNNTNNQEENNVNTNINVNESNEIIITINGQEVKGVLLDTELANEIKMHFPLTVKMVKYSNREYYGGIDFKPTNTSGGKKSFEDGDITYCPVNNTLAVFYNGEHLPNLTMDVIKIGEITDDLDAFYNGDNSEEIIFNFSK